MIGLMVGAAVSAAPVAEDIRDIRGPKYILPDWVLLALIGGAVLVGLSIYGVLRWRRHRAAPVLLPHEIALRRLEDIRTTLLKEMFAKEKKKEKQ